jgi:hypothetical protein
MLYYYQRERNEGSSIAANSIIQFDTLLKLSEVGFLTPSADFDYQESGTEAGAIDILRPGTYLVMWSVAGMTGLSSQGQFYQLKKFDYQSVPTGWEILAGASNHIKVSECIGYNIVIVSEEEIVEHEKTTIALFNSADEAIQPTFFSPKASILIYGFDAEALENRLAVIEQTLTEVFEEIYRIENFVFVSEVTEVWSLAPELSGIGSTIIHTGFTHDFVGIGALDQQRTLNNGTTYYIITGDQYQSLELFVGDTQIGTLWIETPGGNVYSYPLRFDQTGIYFKPHNQLTNLPVGTTFKFSHVLIMIDPEIEPGFDPDDD